MRSVQRVAHDNGARVRVRTEPGHDWAEVVIVPERLVVAPAAGLFWLGPAAVVTSEGEIVQAGQVLGTITSLGAPVEVVSRHTGFLMGLLAADGERVRPHQPLAWVRSFD